MTKQTPPFSESDRQADSSNCYSDRDIFNSSQSVLLERFSASSGDELVLSPREVADIAADIVLRAKAGRRI